MLNLNEVSKNILEYTVIPACEYLKDTVVDNLNCDLLSSDRTAVICSVATLSIGAYMVANFIINSNKKTNSDSDSSYTASKIHNSNTLDNLVLDRFIWRKILKHLDIDSLKNFRETCQYARTLIDEEIFSSRRLCYDKSKYQDFENFVKFIGSRPVNLSLQNITDSELECVRPLNLTTLKLSWCKQITDEGLKSIMCLTNLMRLEMRRCQYIGDEGVKSITCLTKLTMLDLSGCNEITNECVKNIVSLADLRTLDLRFCEWLTSESVKSLVFDTKLEVIYLTGCVRVTYAAVKSLESILTQIRLVITRDQGGSGNKVSKVEIYRNMNC